MTTAFTTSRNDTFGTVYAEEPLARLFWSTASPGIELIKRAVDGGLKAGRRIVGETAGPRAPEAGRERSPRPSRSAFRYGRPSSPERGRWYR